MKITIIATYDRATWVQIKEACRHWRRNMEIEDCELAEQMEDLIDHELTVRDMNKDLDIKSKEEAKDLKEKKPTRPAALTVLNINQTQAKQIANAALGMFPWAETELDPDAGNRLLEPRKQEISRYE